MNTCAHVNCPLLMLCSLFCISWNSLLTNAARGNKSLARNSIYICMALPSTQVSLGPSRSSMWLRTPESTWPTCALGLPFSLALESLTHTFHHPEPMINSSHAKPPQLYQGSYIPILVWILCGHPRESCFIVAFFCP